MIDIRRTGTTIRLPPPHSTRIDYEGDPFDAECAVERSLFHRPIQRTSTTRTAFPPILRDDPGRQRSSIETVGETKETTGTLPVRLLAVVIIPYPHDVCYRRRNAGPVLVLTSSKHIHCHKRNSCTNQSEEVDPTDLRLS